MKTIIIYATKYGSVEKAAEVLKSKLNHEVLLVNIGKEKVPLENFTNVILGGSIYIGKIQKTLANYINSNLPLLLQKRVGLFICAGYPDPDVRAKELQDAFPPELVNHAVVKEIFGYEFRFDKLNFSLRKIRPSFATVPFFM